MTAFPTNCILCSNSGGLVLGDQARVQKILGRKRVVSNVGDEKVPDRSQTQLLASNILYSLALELQHDIACSEDPELKHLAIYLLWSWYV